MVYLLAVGPSSMPFPWAMSLPEGNVQVEHFGQKNLPAGHEPSIGVKAP